MTNPCTYEAIRNAALEEAAHMVEGGIFAPNDSPEVRLAKSCAVVAVRALKSRPAPDHFAVVMPDERPVPVVESDATLLQDCKEKLELYRRTYGNEYIGGVPLLQLVLRIDDAIQGAEK
jgi:hypothetical protein